MEKINLNSSNQTFYPPQSVQSLNTTAVPGTSTTESSMKKANTIFIVLAILVIVGGIATGQGLGRLRAKSSSGDSGVYEGQQIERVPTSR
jgi:hypothetical protein